MTLMIGAMQLPSAPSSGAMKLRGDYSAAGPDYAIEQAWARYTADQHRLWATLLDRRLAMVYGE